ncbi:MAG: OmpA family protein [Dokdonella sp.]
MIARASSWLCALACVSVVGCGSMPARDIDFERLSRSLNQLSADDRLAAQGSTEMMQARSALRTLEEEGRGKQRGHLLYVAERRVDIAWAAAQAADLGVQKTELAREQQRLQLVFARFQAEQARRELERQQLQAQIRAEEAQRIAAESEDARLQGEQQLASANAETEQARRLAQAQARASALARQEAELAGAAVESLRVRLNTLQATQGARGMQMTLGDVAFAPGQASLRAEARGNLLELRDFIASEPDKAILIEGHTDSTGNRDANQLLSQKRAHAVRDALVAEGVDASRISVIGVGAERPMASNATTEGRAVNRRVEVILIEKH